MRNITPYFRAACAFDEMKNNTMRNITPYFRAACTFDEMKNNTKNYTRCPHKHRKLAAALECGQKLGLEYFEYFSGRLSLITLKEAVELPLVVAEIHEMERWMKTSR